MTKFHWKNYCSNCDTYTISDSFELSCPYCESFDIQSDIVKVKDVKVVLSTEDFQEFCDKLFQLMVKENE